MSSQLSEDQAGEVEALASIYGDDFSQSGSKVSILLFGDTTYSASYVGVMLHVEFPSAYPYDSIPTMVIEVSKGLTPEQVNELQALSIKTANENLGGPSIYMVAEALREWLAKHNEKPTDGSEYSQMMMRQRKKEEMEKNGAAQSTLTSYSLESDPSVKHKFITSAADEDEGVRKRRDGTQVTVENFMAWRLKFEKEMELKKKLEEEASGGSATAKVEKGRLTGKQMFLEDSSLAMSDMQALDDADRTGTSVVPGINEALLFLEGDVPSDDEDDEDYVTGESDEEEDEEDDDEDE
jgi:RWD domain